MPSETVALHVVLLTGWPAAGKTTVDRALAGRLRAALVDQDTATASLVAADLPPAPPPPDRARRAVSVDLHGDSLVQMADPVADDCVLRNDGRRDAFLLPADRS